MDSRQYLQALKVFAALNTVGLGLTAGAAIGMYTFSIPIIEVARSSSSEVMTEQFHELILRGAGYIQTASRFQGAGLGALAYLFYNHPDPTVASRWKYFACALILGVQVAWYEVVFVFPTNDKLVDIKGVLKKTEDDKKDMRVRKEVLDLLEKWRRRHIPRIIIPLLCMMLSIGGLSF